MEESSRTARKYVRGRLSGGKAGSVFVHCRCSQCRLVNAASLFTMSPLWGPHLGARDLLACISWRGREDKWTFSFCALHVEHFCRPYLIFSLLAPCQRATIFGHKWTNSFFCFFFGISPSGHLSLEIKGMTKRCSEVHLFQEIKSKNPRTSGLSAPLA